MTAYQVLHAWLETQIGAAKHVRPQGYEMPGERTSAWPETRARAAALVENLPMYDILKPDLVEYFQRGFAEWERSERCLFFQEILEDHLRKHPFYASVVHEIEQVKTPVRVCELPELAERLGVSHRVAQKMCKDGKVVGAYQFERRWYIPSTDLARL